MSKPRNSTKPNKPYKSFPLFPHACGQWAKKVNGKLYYFGPWSDHQECLNRWLKVKDELQAGRLPIVWDTDSLTIAECLNLPLAAKKRLRDAGELSERCFDDYFSAAKLVTECFDKNRPVSNLRPQDFQDLRDHLGIGRGSVTLRNLIRRVRVLFNWSWKNGYIDAPNRLWGTEFNLPSARVLRLERNNSDVKFIESGRLRKLIEDSKGDLKAMIMLGINCAYGPADCGALTWGDLDLRNGWANLPRNKTGKTRRAKLWPATIKALGDSSEGLTFRTRHGNPWRSDAIAQEFRKLRSEEEAIGFYWLRHTFLTIGEETKDFEACRAVMGHIDARVTGQYRSMVSDDRLEAVSEYVRRWLK